MTNNQRPTIIPAANETPKGFDVSRTGALMLAARAAGKRLTGKIEIDRRAINPHNDDNAATIRPPGELRN